MTRGDARAKMCASPLQGPGTCPAHGWVQLIRSWQAPKREAKALKKGKHAKIVEEILEELNRKNHETFYSLAWDPKRGIVAQAQLAEFSHELDTLVTFLRLLEGETSNEVFASLGEGPGTGKKRGWLPWR